MICLPFAKTIYFLLSSIYVYGESIGFIEIIDTRFLKGLYVLRCFKNDLTNFRKCLSVCKYIWFQNFVDTVSQELMLKLMKLEIQLRLDIIWCWLDFGTYRSRSSAVIRNFWFPQHSNIGQNCEQLYLIRIILSQSFWN